MSWNEYLQAAFQVLSDLGVITAIQAAVVIIVAFITLSMLRRQQ